MTTPQRRMTDTPESKHTLFKVYVYGSFVITIAFLATLGFWLLYPYKTIDIKEQPYKIQGSRVLHQGENLLYTAKFEKYTYKVPTQHKQFVDGLIFNVSEEGSKPTIRDPGLGVVLVSIHIPHTLPPGVYYIHIDTYYKMNPIREIHLESRTETFTVLAAKEGVK